MARRTWITAIAAVLLADGIAQAEPLPDAVYVAGGGTFAYGCSLGPHGCDLGAGEWLTDETDGPGLSEAGANSASLVGTTSLAPAPYLGLGGFFSVPGPPANGEAAGFSASQDLTYSFRISGPDGLIPLFVSGAGTMGSAFQPSEDALYFEGGAVSSLKIEGPGLSLSDGQPLGTLSFLMDAISTSTVEVGQIGGASHYSDSLGGGYGHSDWLPTGFNGAFGVDDPFLFAANQVYTVSMYVSVWGWSYVGAGSGSVYASVDPRFTFAPGFENASLYSLEFSQGIGNSPVDAVPEPSAWALMIAGMGLIGGAMRERRAGRVGRA